VTFWVRVLGMRASVVTARSRAIVHVAKYPPPAFARGGG
jgi:hypothetical protein